MIMANSELKAPSPETIQIPGFPPGTLRALHLGLFIAQFNRCSKKEDVHEEIELSGDGRENPKGATDRGHEHKYHGEERDQDRLGDEKTGRHSPFIHSPKVGGEIATSSCGEKSFYRPGDPGADTAKRSSGN